MAINLSIKGVPESLAERLRQRAERNHRSLQGELMAIIEQATADSQAPASAARTVRQGWKTIEDLAAERQARPFVATPGLPLAVDIIRALRDSR
jgi:antitoxin FitA